MNEEEFKECSVVAYPHEIRFLHIKGGHISYYVDRHISDYVNKLQEENQQLKEQLQQKEDIINKAKKYISKHTQHDENGYVVECLYVEEAKELLEILDNKGE